MENAMKQEELLQYMKDAIEVETDLATQEKVYAEYCLDMDKKQPVLTLEPLPEKPVLQATSPTMKITGIILIALALASFLITGGSIGMIFIIALPLFGIGIALFYSSFTKEQNNSKIMNLFTSNENYIKKKNEKTQQEYDRQYSGWKITYNSIHEKMKPNIQITKDLLEKLYAKNILHPKYCTLPALTSIYEYFTTGRCTELTGPHGAYNLYEDEVRKDMIINRLDTVIENMEQIRYNQYTLYQQVKSIKKNSDAMVSELRQIKGYSIAIAELTALNAYYAARTERNTRISMYYDL